MRLIDVLWNYRALAARVPLSQWRFPSVEGEVESRTCCYCRPGPGRVRAKACTHRDPDMVPEGTTFLATYRQERLDDPLAIVALKADIDRLIDALPGKARDMFHLMYRCPKPLRRGEPEPDGDRRLDAVRRMLHIASWRVATASHAKHLAEMERALSDWFPAVRRRGVSAA
jgi:hypothetical protein